MTKIEELVDITVKLGKQIKEIVKTAQEMMQAKYDRAVTVNPSYYTKFGPEVKLWVAKQVLEIVNSDLKRQLNELLSAEFGQQRVAQAAIKLLTSDKHVFKDPDTTPELENKIREMIEND